MPLSRAAVGGQVTAALLNQYADALVGPVTYTPTIANWSSSTIAPTTTGRYWKHGGICTVLVQSKLGTGTITVGAVTVSLPLTMDTTGMILGSTLVSGANGMKDVSAGANGQFSAPIRVVDSLTVQPLRPLQPGTYDASRTVTYATTASGSPFVWATLDELSLMFSYPIV